MILARAIVSGYVHLPNASEMIVLQHVARVDIVATKEPALIIPKILISRIGCLGMANTNLCVNMIAQKLIE